MPLTNCSGNGVNPVWIASLGDFDTGATSTMLSNKVISDLGLIPVGLARFRGIHGVKIDVEILLSVGMMVAFYAFASEKAGKDLLAKRSRFTTDKHSTRYISVLTAHIDPENGAKSTYCSVRAHALILMSCWELV